jgi:hypothetical protein
METGVSWSKKKPLFPAFLGKRLAKAIVKGGYQPIKDTLILP